MIVNIKHVSDDFIDLSTVIYPYYDGTVLVLKGKVKTSRVRFLYLGRIQESKGVGIIFSLALLHPEVDFIIAGEGQVNDEKYLKVQCHNEARNYIYYDLTEYPNVMYVGFVGGEDKTKLLQCVDCLIQPSLYVEPFGLNVLEAAFCGTPSIVPGCGGFKIPCIQNSNMNWCTLSKLVATR